MPTQTEQGKAFEYAMIKAIHDFLATAQPVQIEESSSFLNGQRYFDSLSLTDKERMLSGATAAIRLLIRLEPQLENAAENIPLILSLQEDAQGQRGDVRDILTLRRQNSWVIGISCKHNHAAVKHSRLSKILDFGQKWVGIPCSQEYFERITPLFNELKNLKEENAKWAEITDKSNRFYIPLLTAFVDELRRLTEANAEVPSRLLLYLLGRHDFYKIITKESQRQTIIQGFNFNNTLNQNSGTIRPRNNVQRLPLPRQIYSIDFLNNSGNTICVVFDRGWSIKFRIHNASTYVEPSLKFDINIEGMPPELYTNYQDWE